MQFQLCCALRSPSGRVNGARTRAGTLRPWVLRAQSSDRLSQWKKSSSQAHPETKPEVLVDSEGFRGRMDTQAIPPAGFKVSFFFFFFF